MPAMKKFETLKKKMSVSEEASESIYLNREELKLIEAYKPSGKGEEFTRAIFLICAYTGCRISDAQILSENNFNNGEINFTSIKTKSTSRLPLHPIVPELIKLIKGNTYSETSVKAIVGRCIKDICRNVGINETMTLYRRGERMTQPKWMMVSSHTGRKSFVTNMFLDGYTLEQISRILGHGHGKGDVKITMGYLCTSYTDVVVGNRTYLKPDCDDLYDKLVQMVGLGVSADQACAMLSITGSDYTEVERVRTKYNQNV
jgi:integrase